MHKKRLLHSVCALSVGLLGMKHVSPTKPNVISKEKKDDKPLSPFPEIILPTLFAGNNPPRRLRKRFRNVNEVRNFQRFLSRTYQHAVIFDCRRSYFQLDRVFHIPFDRFSIYYDFRENREFYSVTYHSREYPDINRTDEMRRRLEYEKSVETTTPNEEFLQMYTEKFLKHMLESNTLHHDVRNGPMKDAKDEVYRNLTGPNPRWTECAVVTGPLTIQGNQIQTNQQGMPVPTHYFMIVLGVNNSIHNANSRLYRESFLMENRANSVKIPVEIQRIEEQLGHTFDRSSWLPELEEEQVEHRTYELPEEGREHILPFVLLFLILFVAMTNGF